MTYLDNLLTYFIATLTIVLVLLGFTYYKVGFNYERFKNHWKTTGDGAPAGIIKFIAVLALLSFLAYVGNTKADWFEYTEIYAGIDYTRDISPMCVQNAVDDRLTSNGGVRQHIYSINENISILGNYTHHSCAVGTDAEGYDAAGIQVNWKFKRD